MTFSILFSTPFIGIERFLINQLQVFFTVFFFKVLEVFFPQYKFLKNRFFPYQGFVNNLLTPPRTPRLLEFASQEKAYYNDLITEICHVLRFGPTSTCLEFATSILLIVQLHLSLKSKHNYFCTYMLTLITN